MIAEKLLPKIQGLRIKNMEIGDGEVIVTMCCTRRSDKCPVCSVPTYKIHSCYTRTVADLPWAGIPVRMKCHVRKFFCNNGECKRKVFSERFGPELEPFQRRSRRLEEVLVRICHAAGAEGGSRLVGHLGMQVSADTLIRLILKQPIVRKKETVVILGVDDWAYRKGHDYGTILVDLERNCVIDLLPERSTEVLSNWLKDNPGVKVISRDRASCYSKAAKEGAPDAVQVADRWHLLKNLGDVVQRLLAKFPKQLKAATHQAFNNSNKETVNESPKPEQSEDQPPGPDKPVTTAQSRFRLIFAEVKKLQAEGKGIKATARELGISRTTVRKYRAVDEFPQRARPAGINPSKARRFTKYLLKRWDEGERNGHALWREIREKGYKGSQSGVYRIISEFPGYAADKKRPVRGPQKTSMLSPRKAAKLFSRKETDLEEKELVFCEVMKDSHPNLRSAHPLILDFSEMIREGKYQLFEDWLHKAETSEIPDLCNFAKSLRSDYSAVHAALKLPWSNGQVEGQVNRLKTIKRSMYGRSRFALLKKRVLGPP